MLTNLNTFVAAYMPIYGWDVLQFVLGTLCAVLAVYTRGWIIAMQADTIKCGPKWWLVLVNPKWWSVRIGQFSNALLFAVALFVAADALEWGPAPARTLSVIMLFIAIGLQIPLVHTAWERRQQEKRQRRLHEIRAR